MMEQHFKLNRYKSARSVLTGIINLPANLVVSNKFWTGGLTGYWTPLHSLWGAW